MKKKYGWMIYGEGRGPNSFGFNTFEWMRESAAHYDIDVDILTLDNMNIVMDFESIESAKIMFNGKVMDIPDFAIIRAYNNEVGYLLENLGVRVINDTRAMEFSRNKILTASTLLKNKILTPKIVYKNLKYDIIVKLLGKKFVLKAISGSKGNNVFLINSKNEFTEKAKYFELNGIDFFAQEFIESSYGRDIRVYTLGDKVLGAVVRHSDKDFRSNFSLGGKCDSFELNDDLVILAKKTAKATGLEFAGLDILFTDDNNKYTVCEVNGNAGYQTISSVSDIDIADQLYNYVNREMYL